MVMRLAVTYTPYVTSSKEQTGDVITFAQFKGGTYELKLVTTHKAVTNTIANHLG